jgi:hypothetical protein
VNVHVADTARVAVRLYEGHKLYTQLGACNSSRDAARCTLTTPRGRVAKACVTERATGGQRTRAMFSCTSEPVCRMRSSRVAPRPLAPATLVPQQESPSRSLRKRVAQRSGKQPRSAAAERGRAGWGVYASRRRRRKHAARHQGASRAAGAARSTRATRAEPQRVRRRAPAARQAVPTARLSSPTYGAMPLDVPSGRARARARGARTGAAAARSAVMATRAAHERAMASRGGPRPGVARVCDKLCEGPSGKGPIIPRPCKSLPQRAQQTR